MRNIFYKNENVLDANVGVNKIYSFIQNNQPVKVIEIAQNFDSVTKRTIERWIRQLKDENKVEFRGSPKTGGYYVILYLNNEKNRIL